jgi:hypothetical protein
MEILQAGWEWRLTGKLPKGRIAASDIEQFPNYGPDAKWDKLFDQVKSSVELISGFGDAANHQKSVKWLFSDLDDFGLSLAVVSTLNHDFSGSEDFKRLWKVVKDREIRLQRCAFLFCPLYRELKQKVKQMVQPKQLLWPVTIKYRVIVGEVQKGPKTPAQKLLYDFFVARS